MTLIRFEHRVDGVLTDATSVKFSNPDGTYGLKRTDTDEVLIADNTAITRSSAGVYEHTLTDPQEGLTYDYWIEWVYDGETNHQHVVDARSSSSTKRLDFVVVEDGDPVTLDDPPELEDPLGSFGVKVVGADTVVVASGTPYLDDGPRYWTTFNEPADDLIYRYYVKLTHGGVTYHLPRTTAFVRSAMLAIGRYTDTHQIENAFGVDNVHKWLGIDDQDEPVNFALRAYRFIADAESELDDLLRGGPCTVPFTDTIPATISKIATNMAANRMYESRGVVDMDEETGQVRHRLRFAAKDALTQIARIKSGQLRLSVESVTRYPKVIED